MRLRIALALAILSLVVPACDKPTPVAPAGATITLSINPTRIDPDGEATVTAIVRREDGTPVNPGTIVNFSTSLGTIDETGATDENGVARAKLKGDGRVGMAMVTASTGAAGEVTLEVQIGSTAFSITLETEPGTIDAREGFPQQVTLVALVADDQGAVLPNITVSFSTDAGQLDKIAVVTDATGEARGVVTIRQRDLENLLEPLFLVFATITTDSGTQTAEAEIGVVGVPTFLSLIAQPKTIRDTDREDDMIDVTLRAVVQDDTGEPVAGVAVTFDAALGTLASGGSIVRTDVLGEAVDILTITEQDLDSPSVAVTNRFDASAEAIGFGSIELTDTTTINIQREGAPTVTIIAPADGATFASGATVTFTATATDDEDGDLTPGLTWTSSLVAGSIGSGGTFTLTAGSASLPVGTHTITASVSDSGGRPGLDAITITINP